MKNNNILVFDSVSKYAKIFLISDGKILDSHEENQPVSQSEKLLVNIDKIISRNGFDIADIDVFSLYIGPGSFTGTRIGISVLKGISFAKSKKYVPMTAFDRIIFSSEFIDAQESCLIIKADMKGFYCYTKNTHDQYFYLTNDRLKEMIGEKEYVFYANTNQKPDFDTVLDVNQVNIIKFLEPASDVKITLDKMNKNETVDDMKSIAPVYIKKSQAEEVFEANLDKNISFEQFEDGKPHLVVTKDMDQFGQHVLRSQEILGLDVYSILHKKDIIGHIWLGKFQNKSKSVTIFLKPSWIDTGVPKLIDFFFKENCSKDTEIEVIFKNSSKQEQFYKRVGFETLDCKNDKTTTKMIRRF